MVLILNDVSGSEILLILVFVLMFFGSKSIPGLARTLGRTIRQIKDASSEIQSEIRKSGDEMKKDLNLKGLLEDTAEEIRRPLDQHVQDIENAVRYEPPRVHSHIKPPVVEEAKEVTVHVEGAIKEAEIEGEVANEGSERKEEEPKQES